MADGTIDSLSIEVGASSEKAIQNIKNLTTALAKLKEQSSGIKFGDFKKEIGKLGGNEFAKIEKLANSLGKLKGISLNKSIAENMLKIAEASELIDQSHVEKIAKFGTSLQSLKSVNTRGYKELPASILNIAAAVDSITDDSIKRLSRLTQALGRLRGIDFSGMGTLLKAQNDAWKINQKQQKLNQTGGAGKAKESKQVPRGGQSGKGKTVQVEDELKKSIAWTLSLRKNVSLLADEWKKVGAAISSAIPGPMKLVLNIVGGIGRGVFNIAKGIAKWTFHTAVNAVKSLWNGLKKVASTVVTIGKNFAKSLYDRSIFKIAIDAYKSLQKVLSGIGRVAFYRAIRSAIKYVTDALKEGTENAYWYAREFGEATRYIADAYDQMSGSNFKMSNQLGAAWATLIATIEPIILRIISLVTKAAEVVTQFFALLGGSGTYLKAVDYNKKWADSAGGAAKAAKEWKNQLLGFDEINRLEEPSQGSGGGGSDTPDYGSMFEEAQISSKFFDQLKDAFERGEWARLGKLLGNKFNEIVNSIDFAGFGKKIGKGIQAAVDTAYNFLKTADFRNLGQKLAEMIDSLADEIDFNELGRLSKRISTAIWDILYGAFTKPGSMKRLAVNLGNFIVGSLDELAEWLESLSPQKIADALSDFIGNINYGGIAGSFVTVIKNAWRLFADTKDMFLQTETGQKITTKLTEFFGGLTWTNVRDTIKTKLGEAWAWITDKFEEIWPKEDRDTFMGNVKEKLQEILENAIRKIDFAAAHNIFAYKLDEAFFGEERAKKMWYNKGEFAGRELILGTDYGIEQQNNELKSTLQSYITDPVSQSLYDMETQARDSGAQVSKEIKKSAESASGDLDSISSAADNVSGSFSSMCWNGSSDINGFAGSVSGSSWTIMDGLYGIAQAAADAWGWLKSLFNLSSNGSYSYDLPNGNKVSYNPNKGGVFAGGGFPEDGLFFANHGELVGQFSNGKTAVANNEQITAGIADAVYDAFMTAFSQTGGNNGNGQPVNIYLDGRQIAQTTTKYQNQFARASGI